MAEKEWIPWNERNEIAEYRFCVTGTFDKDQIYTKYYDYKIPSLSLAKKVKELYIDFMRLGKPGILGWVSLGDKKEISIRKKTPSTIKKQSSTKTDDWPFYNWHEELWDDMNSHCFSCAKDNAEAWDRERHTMGKHSSMEMMNYSRVPVPQKEKEEKRGIDTPGTQKKKLPPPFHRLSNEHKKDVKFSLTNFFADREQLENATDREIIEFVNSLNMCKVGQNALTKNTEFSRMVNEVRRPHSVPLQSARPLFDSDVGINQDYSKSDD